MRCFKRQPTKHHRDQRKKCVASLHNFWKRGHHDLFSVARTFFPGILKPWCSGGARGNVGPSQRQAVAAAAAAAAVEWQDSERTLWGLKVPKASWVISHYGAVTEGSAVNTEIIWAMVNDSAVQAFGMIKDRSSCTRHLSGPWITPPASSWVTGAERIAGEACADTQINMFPLSPLATPGNGY